MMEQRPNPERLLQRAQAEESQLQRGKLKIYLGAAPGVGKTYTMLEDAIAKREEGLDVIIGTVDAHGRVEIKELMSHLEALPPQVIEYHDKKVEEFDIDAALKRNPGLILIDEMAHTNVPGLRHTKRWQDIKELLDRGLDVYTTLNVQHIESLNDVVSKILGIHVQETVPDFMLELANAIELIDLPPEELLKRLQEGKIYFPQQAELAKENFFRKGNITALRELALRVTAERVGTEVFWYRQDQGIKTIWPIKEKILVCVGYESESLRLIRVACRMATMLQAEWIALHVEIPRLQDKEELRNNAIQNLRFAEQLGAKTRIVTESDLVKAIIAFAQEQNITQIVIGQQIRPRWKELFSSSLATAILRKTHEIDVHIITQEKTAEVIRKKKKVGEKPAVNWQSYGIAIGSVALATIINFLIYPFLTASSLVMIYMLAVITAALLSQRAPVILAPLLSVLAYDFFFIPPFYSFRVSDIQDALTLIIMLIVLQIINRLTILTRRQVEQALSAEQRTEALYKLSRQLASMRGVDKLLEIATEYIAELFDSDVIVLLPGANERLTIRAKNVEAPALNEKDRGVAQWVYELGQIAGLGTDTLSFSDAIYIPLSAKKGSVGVLRIRPHQSGSLFSPEQIHLLEASARQIALALEVDQMFGAS